MENTKKQVNGAVVWNISAKAGLVLGLISSAYLLYGKVIETTEFKGFFASLLTFVVWAVKFGACVYLMKYYLKGLRDNYSGVGKKQMMNLGMRISLLSALVYAGFTLAEYLIISPDYYANMMDTMMGIYAQSMDEASLEVMESMMSKLPTISFFSTLIYSFLFGTVLSSIWSSKLDDSNPFSEN